MPCFSAWLSLPKTRVVTDGATPAAESRGRRLDRLTWRVDALPLRYAASTVYGIAPHADIAFAESSAPVTSFSGATSCAPPALGAAPAPPGTPRTRFALRHSASRSSST
jgi:hypothetical protein